MNLDLIQRPFPSDQIRRRKTALGTTLDYLETHTVIARLNETFGGLWSFKILDHKLLEDDVVVLGELTAEGVTKQQFGTCELRQEGDEGVVLSMGDALKAAASDALKKAATLFGIGLHLYHSAESAPVSPPEAALPEPTPEPEPEPAPEPGPPPDLITDFQVAEIIELAKQRKITQAQVERRARERYGRGLAELTQAEAQEIITKLRPR
ncbi:MAG: hypothetical protein HY710_16155 [Candidatus Latescibacteria bacterium]|nr:hypothetical protein [Candidatus Latescibacterota bacterium]